ncbi:GntR family transcriptional regulator [Brevibacterium sanguinis]|uniref:GntR family transcriptional regulator n=3 Tax=Brevibacterium TaxID=1696 RepID=A0A366INY7_9MICO|nr:GntR family transcriptional regulator [Brevibacterium celere]RBP67800.1 GntR family transcriptional regulator [Brevibacterium sanguinis]RBP74783.1 GntR family transcriptional regulator [Brevibacterium celere]
MYAELRTRIENGELAEDEQLPPELELAKQFGVSRGTARQAVSRLVLEGLVERTAGRGTFVSSRRLVFTARELLGFTEQIRASGRVPSSQVMDISVVPATEAPHTADFGPSVDQLISLERVRLADGEPIALEHMFLPFPRFAGLRDIHLEDRSVYDTLEEVFGTQLTMGEFSLDIADLNKRQAELLNERVHSAAFVMEGSVRDQLSSTVVSVRAFYRRNKFSFTFSTPRGAHTPMHYAQPRLVLAPTPEAMDPHDLNDEF